MSSNYLSFLHSHLPTFFALFGEYLLENTFQLSVVLKLSLHTLAVLNNWSNERDWRKTPEPYLACLLSIKVSGSSLKAFSEQHYLKAVKLTTMKKTADWIRKREIKKIKATKPIQKVLSPFKTSKKVNSWGTMICWCDLYFKLAFRNLIC